MSLAEVEQARVHITFPKDSVFLESRQPAKASVLVKLRPGAQLSPQNVAAICQLTASAVEGLAPEAVSVVDMRGNLLNRARRASSPDDPEPSEAALEYRQKIEHDLLAKINSTLEPLLGARQISRHSLGGVRLQQRRTERGNLRPQQVGDGDFAKNRRHQRRDRRGGRSRHRLQPAAADLAARHRKRRCHAANREHQLSIQPHACGTCACRKDGEAHVGVAAGGFRRPLGRHRSEGQADRRTALGREAESHSRSGGGRHRILRRARRSAGGGDAAV